MKAAFYRFGAVVLLALCAAMLWTPAHAAFPALSSEVHSYSGQGGGPYSTAIAACEGFRIERGLPYKALLVDSPSSSRCYNSNAAGTAYVAPNTTITRSFVLTCSANSTLANGQCTCNAPSWVQDGNACISQQSLMDKNCKALADGLNLVGDPLVHYGSAGLTACFGGYVMSGTGAASGGGQTELYGPFKCTGANAASCNVVSKPSDITANCAAGSYPGTVNGVQVCVPPSSSVQAPETTTTTPPVPGGTAPDIPGAPSGTTTQEKQTACDGPTCTTTTTYKDGSGASTGSKTETTPKSSYCAENPKAPGCESLEDSTFSGSCDGGFSFKGDAIQGAIAKEIHKQNCLMNAPTAESAKYDAAKLKTGDQTADLPGNETRAIGPADIDQTNAIVGGTCIADRTITINLIATTTTVVLPFSSVCPLLEYFRWVLIALGFFIAYRIIGGR